MQHPKSRPETHVHRDSHKSMSGATAQLASALQQHIQALACGNSAASIAMLHDLTTFLESYKLHRSSTAAESSRVATAAATAAAGHSPLSQGLSHHHTAGAEAAQTQAGAWTETASDAVEAAAAAALHVVAVLVANDKSCQQIVMQAFQPETAPPKVWPLVLKSSHYIHTLGCHLLLLNTARCVVIVSPCSVPGFAPLQFWVSSGHHPPPLYSFAIVQTLSLSLAPSLSLDSDWFHAEPASLLLPSVWFWAMPCCQPPQICRDCFTVPWTPLPRSNSPQAPSLLASVSPACVQDPLHQPWMFLDSGPVL